MSRVALTEAVFEATNPASFGRGLEVFVYQRGTEEEAPLYSAEEGEATLSQPLTTDKGGRARGAGEALPWLDEGSYDLSIGGQTVPFEAAKGGTDTSGGPAGGDLAGTYPNPTVKTVPEAALPSSVVSSSSYSDAIGPRTVAKIRANVEDVVLLALTDSTGADGLPEETGGGYADTNSWPHHLAESLAALFASHKVQIVGGEAVKGEGASGTYDWAWNAPTVLQAGTGGKTISVYIGAVSGTQEQYALGGLRLKSMVREIAPDLVFASYGHNISAETTRFGWRLKSLANSILAAVATAELCLIAQNAQGEAGPQVEAQTKRAKEVQRIARLTGSGFVNFCQLFLDEGATKLTNADGIHPNSLGVKREVETLLAGLRRDIDISALAPNASGVLKAIPQSANPLINGDLADYVSGASTLNGWTLTNVTVSADETHFESTRGFAVKLTGKGEGSTTQITQTYIVPRSWRGRYITLRVRLYVPSGQADDSKLGSVSLADNIAGTSSTLVSVNCRDGWYDEVITIKVDPAASNVTAKINVNASEATTSNISIEQAVLALGDEPRGLIARTVDTSGRPDFPNGTTTEGQSLETGSAEGTALRASKVSGDAQSRYVRTAKGTQSWGGGSSGTDVTLERSGAGVLKLATGQFWAAQGLILACASAAKTENYSAAKTDCVIPVDTSTNAVTITLPAASGIVNGEFFIVKDVTGNASVKNITIKRSGSDTIDGAETTKIEANYGSKKVVRAPSGWAVI